MTMTLMAAIGCGLIGFGPVGVLFILSVARDPLQVILFTLSAFFWLAGLLASSLIWFAVVPLRDQLAFGLVFACLLQEVVRFLFYLLVTKSESSLLRLAEAESNDATGIGAPTADTSSTVITTEFYDDGRKEGSIFNLRTVSFTSGLGFALMGCITEYIYAFYDVIGPSTVMQGPNPGYFFMFAAIDSCCMALLQVAWSIVLFRSYRLRRYVNIVGIIALHVLLSCLSLLNEWASPAPEVVCAVYALSVILSFVWAFFVAGGRFPQLRRSASLDQPQQTANSILS